jgi:hypothetical protein
MPSSVIVSQETTAAFGGEIPAQVEHSLFPADAGDPVAQFLRKVCRLEWPHLFVLTFIIYGPLEKLWFPYAGGYRRCSDVEALLTGFFEFPFFFAFYLWSGGHVAQIFSSFTRNKSFTDESRYLEFRRAAAQAFRSPVWWVLGVVAGIGLMLLYHYHMWSEGSTAQRPWFEEGGTRPRVLALGLLGLLGYVVSQTVIRQALALVWLRRLWRQLPSDLVLHPYHRDQAGGLGAIGQHAIALSWFFAVAMLCALMGSLLPSLRSGNLSFAGLGVRKTLDRLFWDPTILGGWAILVAGVVVGLAGLLAPAHAAMINARNRRLEPVARDLEERVTRVAAHGTAAATVSGMLDEIKQLKAIRKILLADVPVWPISVPSTRWLTGSLIVPVAVNVLSALLKAGK